eukprot:TRINITY_DN1110_c0_g1_i1.p1 TRINITY_DN1110_c0_g1~~TRINITY_DN1110_c0_g1_i1.p1  ORF type:complete len:753 (-),score=141.73 TRINITY_DN1110_c0_g1_i1:197-2347(-)
MLNLKRWHEKYLEKLKGILAPPSSVSPASAAGGGDGSRNDSGSEGSEPHETSTLLGSSSTLQDYGVGVGIVPLDPSEEEDEDEDVGGGDFITRLDTATPSAQMEELSYRKLWNHDKAEFWKRILRRSPYYLFPPLLWLPQYQWADNILSDIITGVGVACMLIPQALAYASLAEVPAQMGLYTALIPVVVFSLMTTSRHVHAGPDALASLLVGLTLVKPHAATSNLDPAHLAPIYSLICGLTLLLMGIFRFGFLDNVLSRPLLAGFVNAVAVIILVMQFEPLLGLKPSHGEAVWEKVVYLVEHVSETHIGTLLCGVLFLFILIGSRVYKHFFPFKWTKYVVDTLIVVVLGIGLSWGLSLEKQGVAILGHVESGFPLPAAPQLTGGGFADNFPDSVVICIIGFVETIVAAKLYATKHNYQISPNRELVALGVSNVVGSFFHSYPTFGSLTRSSVADFLGAKSQLYSLVSSVFVVITILFLTPVVYYLPRVAMSAIICVAAASLVELHDLMFLWRIRAWKELSLLLFTFVVTIAFGVDIGIFIGIGVSLLMVVNHTSVPHISVLGKSQYHNSAWVDVMQETDAVLDPGVLVVRIEESLYFANIEQIKDMFTRIEIFGSYLAHPTAMKVEEPLRAIVVHAKSITEMDASAIQTIYEMMLDYQKRGIFLCFVKLRSSLKKSFLLSGIIGGLGGDRIFVSTDEAMKYVNTVVLPNKKRKKHH